MSKLLITALAFPALLALSDRQNDCEGYYPLEKGVHWKQSHYDAKGKLSSRMEVTEWKKL